MRKPRTTIRHPGRGVLMGVIICSLAASAQAQRYSLYVHAYMNAEKHPSIKVSSSISYNSLVFLKRDDLYEATYELFLSLKNSKGRVVETAVLKKTITVPDYKETKSKTRTSKLAKTFLATPGRYVLEATLAVKNTLLRSQRKVELTVPDFLAAGVGLSKPQVFAVERAKAEKYALFERLSASEKSLLKQLERNFFSDADGKPAIVFEVYAENIKVDSIPCRLYMEVMDDAKNQMFYANREVKLSGNEDQFLTVLDIDDWEPGSYKINAKAVLENPHREAEVTAGFSVAFTRSMLARHFDQTLSILEIIAEPGEIEELRKAPPEKRRTAWERFWKKRDPTPDTEENEALEEHLRRVRYVMANFSSVEPGWKSDRGRIYIKYGEPDQIESSMDPYLRGEYEIWRYYRLNLVIVFFDRFGLGDYRLISINGY